MNFRAPRAAITVLFAANGLLVGAFAASIPRLAERLSLQPAGVAIAVFVTSLGAISVMPFVGRAIDCFGGRPVALAGAAFVPVFLPLTVEAGSFWQVLAMGFCFGFTIGTLDVAMNAYAVAAERAAGASWIASVHGAWSVGNVGGIVGLVALAARGVPLPSVAVSALVVLGIIVFAFVAPPITHEIEQAAGGGSQRALLMLGILAACALSIEGAMADWAALYARSLHASLVLAPLTYAAFAGAMMLTRFFGDGVIVRFGRIATLGASGVLSAAALAAALIVPNLVAVSLAFAVAGVGCANLAPTILSAAGRIGAGRGMATVTGIGYSAFLAGPSAIGAVAQFAGLRVALSIAVACAVVVALGARWPVIRAAVEDREAT